MLVQALRIAASSLVQGFIAANFGCQATGRPIFLGMFTGLFCGNVAVGATMGALMEAVYMGVSAVGGVSAANTTVSTKVGTGLMIFQGVDVETAVTLATVIGSVTNSFSAIPKALRSAWYPVSLKQCEKGNWSMMKASMWFCQIVIQVGWSEFLTVLCYVLGTEFLDLVLTKLPAFILRGLNAAGNMLVVIGFALTTQCIWMKNCFWYVLLGFCLAKYLNMSTLPVAFIGTILAILTFTRDSELKEIKESAATAANGGDDFYG